MMPSSPIARQDSNATIMFIEHPDGKVEYPSMDRIGDDDNVAMKVE